MRPAVRSPQGIAALVLLAGTLLFGLGRVALLPPFEGYDETGHYSYVAQIAALGTVPARGDPMSAETEAYGRVAATPPSAGRVWSYAALAHAAAEEQAAARSAVATPTADPRWRAGTLANWEAQHPPLYYALLAPAFRLAEGWSLGSRLLLLRSLSYAIAWGGLLCAAWAASGFGRVGRGEPAPSRLSVLAPALWPILLPEWYPEMARLGNDALVALLSGIAWLMLRRLLARDLPQAGSAAHAGLGAVVGLGMLVKATVLPLAAAAGLVLAARAWRSRRQDRAARLRGVAAYAVAMLVVAGWWYVGQILRTGDPIGANDGIVLAQGEGLVQGLRHHLSPATLARVFYDFDLSLVWNGTWSFVVPPLPFMLPMMVIGPVLGLAGLWAHRRRMSWLDAVAPLTLALFTAALVYYSLVLIAGGGLGQPAWYLHSFAPVLWPLLAWGLDASRRSAALRVLLVVDLVYAPLFLLVATASDAAFYAGCAGTRGGDRYLDVPAVLGCLATPGRLVDGLAILTRPWPAVWLLGSGLVLVGLGTAAALLALLRSAAPAEAFNGEPAPSAPTGSR